MAKKNGSTAFSVIIPTLNEEKYLPYVLDDLLLQTFTDFEVIIVDGNSTDKTKKIAKAYKKSFKKLTIISTKKRNVSHQRNLGAAKAKSVWLLFMDADNRLPGFFLQGIKYRSESTNSDIFTTWMNSDMKDNVIKAVALLTNILMDIQKNTEKPYLYESFVAVKKSTFEKLKGFKESLPFGEGNDLAKRALAKKISLAIVKDPKYTYSYRRIRANGKLKHFLKVSQIEIARLTNSKIPRNYAKKLYPMEGGKYFEVNSDITSQLKRIYLKIVKAIKQV